MIKADLFKKRVNEVTEGNGIVELPENLVELVAGAGPGDFHDVFRDANPEPGGPSFIDNFHDVWPYDDHLTIGGVGA